jgi:hypothetical protein
MPKIVPIPASRLRKIFEKDGFQLSVISFQLREMQDEISISLVFSI